MHIKNTIQGNPGDAATGFDDIEKRLNALAEGFQEYIPQNTIPLVSTASFNQMLGGIKLNIELFDALDIEDNTGRLTTMKRWLKEIAVEQENVSPGFLSKLMFFWTGSKSIPSDISSNPLKIADDWRHSTNYLPQSHTCFNRIDIPNYSSKEIFKIKLIQAVEMAQGTED